MSTILPSAAPVMTVAAAHALIAETEALQAYAAVRAEMAALEAAYYAARRALIPALDALECEYRAAMSLLQAQSTAIRVALRTPPPEGRDAG